MPPMWRLSRPSPPGPPSADARWRGYAAQAAMERERGGMEASAVGWGRAPRTRDGGLSVRSWFLGLINSQIMFPLSRGDAHRKHADSQL